MPSGPDRTYTPNALAAATGVPARRIRAAIRAGEARSLDVRGAVAPRRVARLRGLARRDPRPARALARGARPRARRRGAPETRTAHPLSAAMPAFTDLKPQHRRILFEQRAIDPEVATERGYRSVEGVGARALGYVGRNARAGLAIPLHTVWGDQWGEPWAQLRPDDPVVEELPGGKRKVHKYLRPTGSQTVLDVHPRWLGRLNDPVTPVAIVEGIPKADALTSIGVMAVALLGVDCWSGNGGVVLSDFRHFNWKGRRVLIAFDSDTRTNPNVQRAARRLAEELRRRGADVYLALPPARGKEKVGWDDYLARLKPERRKDSVVFERAKPIDEALPELRPRIHVVTAADVEPEEVTYLWPPYVPDRKLTVVDGDAGLGKTFLLLRLAAAMSTGATLPGGPNGDPVAVKGGNTLYFTMEDGLADTVVPRFLKVGGDAKKLVLSKEFHGAAGENLAFTFQHLGALEELLEKERPRLVVFDPLLGYLGAEVDAHRSNQTRPILAELGRVAEAHGCAVVGIRHTRKSREGGAVHAGLGTVDITAAARSVLIVGKHPVKAGVSVLAHTKSSTCRAGASLEFSIDDEGRFEWGGTSTLRADDLVAAPRRRGPEPRVRDEVEAWLQETLVGGEVKANEVYRLAAARGYARSTINRAADRLGVVRTGEPGSRSSGWRLKF